MEIQLFIFKSNITKICTEKIYTHIFDKKILERNNNGKSFLKHILRALFILFLNNMLNEESAIFFYFFLRKAIYKHMKQAYIYFFSFKTNRASTILYI